jgi:hypothetical protein
MWLWPSLDQQAPCHGEKPNKMIVFGTAEGRGGRQLVPPAAVFSAHIAGQACAC